MKGFDLLHPALQHHIVNSLEWRQLRPLQEAAVEPLLQGEHALLVAPTAGGKTEAAVFPLLSRAMAGNWPGLSILYVCPLRALINNLEPRLTAYGAWVGRRAALWHGDVLGTARRRIASDPPDFLLITPESIESILISSRWDHDRLFGDLRAVVVDEVHAFAGDDRGWHLLALLERLTRIAGRELQRVALSATVGNPPELLDWLAGYCEGPRRVIQPDGLSSGAADVILDYVGSLENAATVISRLYDGEKRLVFCDSRSEAEALTAHVRNGGVNAYVSHSSLSPEERRRAETAFASDRNCVIVATSTLELGVDIGDLDHVLQIGAPWSVSSFLQRLGRSGRRAGGKRDFTFLCLSEDTLMRAGGIATLWSEGYVEMVQPPASPFNIVAQQLMALALQTAGVGRHEWERRLSRVPTFAEITSSHGQAIVSHMLEAGILYESDARLWFGEAGERLFGRRNWSELLASFDSERQLVVRYGRQILGFLDPTCFSMDQVHSPIVLLGGRSWMVNHTDWKTRTVYVEPSQDRGKSRWLGEAQPASFDVCQAIQRFLPNPTPGVRLSKRGISALDRIREDFAWLEEGDRSYLVRGSKASTWWTFSGLRANAALASVLRRYAGAASAGNLAVSVAGQRIDPDRLHELLRSQETKEAVPDVDDRKVKHLKFSDCLPHNLSTGMLQARTTDRRALEHIISTPVRDVVLAG